MPNATASGADASNGNARNREHNQGNQERKYTVEQKQAVLRIRACGATAFYDILGLEAVRASCSDADVKKAYRKQSLLTHPDKNGHPHADEAFKMVARAFSVLGDKDKRDKYDRFGTDPDSRFASAQQQQQQQNPFAGFASRGGGPGMGGMGGQGMWEDEISPEEMFARFFGGGMPFAGGAFDTGPQFVFNLGGGGPGIRVHQFGGPRPRGRPRNPDQAQQQDANLTSTLLGLLPILLLFVFPLLSSIFASSTFQPAVPGMVFESPQPPVYTQERKIPSINVKYYVNPRDIESYSSSKLYQLDKTAEAKFVQNLGVKCDQELMLKQRMRDDAVGWFFPDPEKMQAAERIETPSCTRLRKMGQ